MAAYRRVYDSRHLQADYQEPGSAPEPYARQSSMGYLCLFTFTMGASALRDPWDASFLTLEIVGTKFIWSAATLTTGL